MMKKKINHYNRISALFFIGVGVFFSLYGRTVEVGVWSEPGPGFMPFWSGIVLTVMAVFLLLGSFKRKEWQVMPPFFPLADSWKRVLIAFLSLIAYLLLFKRLGFVLTTFLFIGFLLKAVFPQTWAKTFVTAFLTAVCAWLLFVHLLETQLPKGFLGF